MADLQQRERAVEKMRHNRRMRRRIYAVLGAVVVLATAFALMMPAISATRSTKTGTTRLRPRIPSRPQSITTSQTTPAWNFP